MILTLDRPTAAKRFWTQRHESQGGYRSRWLPRGNLSTAVARTRGATGWLVDDSNANASADEINERQDAGGELDVERSQPQGISLISPRVTNGGPAVAGGPLGFEPQPRGGHRCLTSRGTCG